MQVFERTLVSELRTALAEAHGPIQVVTGPRQVGKTTAARAVFEGWDGPKRFAAADEFGSEGPDWIRHAWSLARRDAKGGPSLLVLDEVQKIPQWSETVKGLYDGDRREGRDVRVVLLGSSALLLARGGSESLAGRFRPRYFPHWTFAECRSAFGWSLERWLFFGGYPGAAKVADDVDEWRARVRDALVEPTLARDVLALESVSKPALLRSLFSLACRRPAQAIAYNKMLGELNDAGNTTTLANYLVLLERAFLVSGLEKFSGGVGRRRGSSPKLVLWNPALVSALDVRSPEETRSDAAWWGRLVENAVGAHLMNGLRGLSYEIAWWRDGDDEADYVVRGGSALHAIEVKSGRDRSGRGLKAFVGRHPKARPLVIGGGGIPLSEFLLADPATLLRDA